MTTERRDLRLLIIASDKYPAYRVDVTVLFARELAANGFAIDWILQAAGEDQSPGQHAWGSGTVRVGRTDCGNSRLHRLRKHWLGFRNDLQVLRLAVRGRYDVVQVRDKYLIALPALWAAPRAGAAFSYWLSFPHAEASTYVASIGAARFPLLYRLRGRVLFHLLYRWVLPAADHVFVQSEQMKSDLVGFGLTGAKMTAVPMGIDLHDFAEFAPDLPQPLVAPATIAYLGTLAAERRIDFLVRCLALVLAQRPDARLLLVGDSDRPADVQRIRAEARRLAVLDRIEITGFLPRPEALRRVSRATVCVSPFYPTPILKSTSPTKLIEYMALGRPVVANDHPEQRLVLARSRAGLCVEYAEDEFAAAIVRIMNSPQEAAAMGRRGREFVAAHRTYPRIAAVVAQTYRDLVARRTPCAGTQAALGQRLP